MRTLSGFGFALLLAGVAAAQSQSGIVSPRGVTPARPSVVYPAGTPNLPGYQRVVGSVVHPSGTFPQIGIPSTGPRGTAPNRGAYIYQVPVYVGGYYYDGMYGEPQPAQQQQQQPNVTVIYPPQQATPVIINYPERPHSPDIAQAAQPTPQAQVQAEPADEPVHYMLAFKDRNIYAAIAYWVDGDTLHYFTNGNVHNQASVSLVDRELTERLNRGSGVQVKLPN